MGGLFDLAPRPARVRVARGGRLHLLTLSGVRAPLANGAELLLFDRNFRSPWSDGITDEFGNGWRRLRQFLADTGPTHPVDDPRTGKRSVGQFFFSHVIVGVHEVLLHDDVYECDGEGRRALAQGLESLIAKECGRALWEPALGIRVVIVPHRLHLDQVTLKLGRAIYIPDPEETPIADLSVTLRAEDGTCHPVPLPPLRQYVERDGRVDMIDQPIAIYRDTRHILLGADDALTTTALPMPPGITGQIALPARLGIDVKHRRVALESGDQTRPIEIAPDAGSEPDTMIFTLEQDGLSPVPGSEPPALIITIRQRPAPVVVEPIPEIIAAAAPVAAPAPVAKPQPEVEEGDTVVVGARPGIRTAAVGLDVIGILLPTIEPGGGVRRYVMMLDEQGAILNGDVVPLRCFQIGVQANKPGIFVAYPGEARWRPVAAGGEIRLSNGESLALLALPQALVRDYLAMVDLPSPVTFSLPAGRHVLGRTGGIMAGKLSIGLLARPGSLEADGAPAGASMEQLGLSKDHLALQVDGKELLVEMLGRTNAWRLSPDLDVVETLEPGDGRTMRLAIDDCLVVGPYLLRVREI